MNQSALFLILRAFCFNLPVKTCFFTSLAYSLFLFWLIFLYPAILKNLLFYLFLSELLILLFGLIFCLKIFEICHQIHDPEKSGDRHATTSSGLRLSACLAAYLLANLAALSGCFLVYKISFYGYKTKGLTVLALAICFILKSLFMIKKIAAGVSPCSAGKK